MASNSKTENKNNKKKAITKQNSKTITKSKNENKNKNESKKKEKVSHNNNKNKNKKRENENANANKKKNDNNSKKKKKLTHSNGTSKHRGHESLVSPSSSTDSQQKRELESVDEEVEEDNTVVSNGRTDGKKPKKSKRNREEVEDEDEGDAKSNVFPMNRIRTIVKAEDPEMRVSQEAIFVVNKAAEKFLEQFTQDAYVRCVQERRKSLSYNYLAHVVSKQRRYEFLSDFVPETVKAEDALRERNSGGNGGN